jgi:hypothetical protein
VQDASTTSHSDIRGLLERELEPDFTLEASRSMWSNTEPHSMATCLTLDVSRRGPGVADQDSKVMQVDLCMRDAQLALTSLGASHALARTSKRSRSRRFFAKRAARSNSRRASELRPSLTSRSPRTLGNR